MSLTVCLAPSHTIDYADGGGHLWVYLNWALGLRALGCRVLWLECVDGRLSADAIQKQLGCLRRRLEPYGLADSIALTSSSAEPLTGDMVRPYRDLDGAAAEADLLLNLRYGLGGHAVRRFRRSALLGIDPGLLQIWIARGDIRIAAHDVYFTIGETVGRPEARFPDAGLPWQYTPPCIALEWWPVRDASPEAPFTTVSHWYANEWMIDDDGAYANDKRSGFLPFLDMPSHVTQPLELALCLVPDDEERSKLTERGWRIRHTYEVASTPWDYQRYVQESRGEFSCAKPSCVRLQNAWVSDRTLCYLASGKPAVVQHTGPSRFVPDAGGLFRFRDVAEATRCLETVAADYDRQCRLARALAEEHFDARKVVARVLEQAMS